MILLPACETTEFLMKMAGYITLFDGTTLGTDTVKHLFLGGALFTSRGPTMHAVFLTSKLFQLLERATGCTLPVYIHVHKLSRVLASLFLFHDLSTTFRLKNLGIVKTVLAQLDTSIDPVPDGVRCRNVASQEHEKHLIVIRTI